MLPETFTPELLKSLELFKLQARRAFLGTRQGGHLSLKRGHGIEFSDYRQYELGDNPRHIDWGVYARSERLYIKRFQEEQDLHVLLLLDSSASMSAVPQDGKWERARDIAIALGYVALMEQDTVSVSLLGKSFLPGLYGGRAIHNLGRFVSEARTGGQSLLAREINQAAVRVRFPGVAILISDLMAPLEEIEKGLNALRARNLDITVVQVFGRSDLVPAEGALSAEVIDSETGERAQVEFTPEVRAEYQRLLESHVAQIEAFCADAHIGYVRAKAEEDFPSWIQEALPAVGLLR